MRIARLNVYWILGIILAVIGGVLGLLGSTGRKVGPALITGSWFLPTPRRVSLASPHTGSPADCNTFATLLS